MRTSSIISSCLLILVAITAYLLTIYMDRRTPEIIVQPKSTIESLETKKIAQNFSFTDSNGKSHSLKDFEGKIVILNSWASWCPPCVKEFPHLLRAAKEFKNDVILVGISSDLDAESMNKFLSKLGPDINNSNILMTLSGDRNLTKSVFKTYQIPETLLLDRAQNIRTKIIGGEWHYEDLKKKIEHLL